MRPVAGYTPRDWAVEFPDSVAGSHAEHSLLVDAIEDGRADDARAIAENHVVAAGNDYIEYYMRIGARIFDACTVRSEFVWTRVQQAGCSPDDVTPDPITRNSVLKGKRVA